MLPFHLALAQTPTPTVPPGFRLIDSDLGIQLYTKEYSAGSPDFIQVIDLSQGARLELMYGDITEDRPTKGSFGGPDPRMTSPALQTYWQRISTDPYAFCVTNGSFFYMPEYPTRLAFPLKVNGQVVTEGWGINTYPEQKLILELWQDHADIQPLSQEALYESNAPNLIGGLTEEANKRAKYAVGRTFVGIQDRDGDGSMETVLVLNTQTAVQAGAASVLRQFGADQVMMLDGGGSTQLLCRSGWHIRSDRPIPQAIGIFAAKPPPIATRLLRKPDWPVLVAGNGVPLEMSIQNTGTISWTSTTTQFVLDTNYMGIATLLPMQDVVKPGATMVLTDTLRAFNRPGVYPLQIKWGIRYNQETFEGESIDAQVVVIPSALEAQRGDLEVLLDQWRAEQPEQVESLVMQWIKERDESLMAEMVSYSPTSMTENYSADAIWIPLLMLPIVIILGIVIGKINRKD